MNKLILVIIVMGIFTLFGCQEPPRQVNFRNLTSISSENYYIVCPPKYCNIKPNEISPVFPFNREHLDIHWQQVIKNQKRVTLLEENKQDFQYTYRQRTKYLGFPDTINVQLMAIDNNHSTIAIYSQSKYGYYDFGMNQKRVIAWLDELIDSIGEQHKL